MQSKPALAKQKLPSSEGSRLNKGKCSHVGFFLSQRVWSALAAWIKQILDI